MASKPSSGSIDERGESSREGKLEEHEERPDNLAKELGEQPDYLGEMTIKCDHCGSLFFKDEEKFCCDSGKIKIVNPFADFPECIKNRLDDGHCVSINKWRAEIHGYAKFQVKSPVEWCDNIHTYQTGNLICKGEVQHVAVDPNKYKDDHRNSEHVKNHLNQHNTISKAYGMLPMLTLRESESVNPVSFLHNLLSTQGGSALDLNSDGMLLPRNSPLIDPMLYPLFFPNGTLGWHEGLKNSGSDSTISQVEYYKYLAMKRDCYNPIHHGRLLTRLFFMDVWARIDQNILEKNKDSERPMYLSPEHPGSYRNLDKERRDSYFMFFKSGGPHIFITFTANPKWREIQENLGDCKDAHDRPDLIARVFKLKADRMLEHLVEKNIFGKVEAYAMCYEWQKRGLPHIHLLLTMEDSSKVTICEEMPDKKDVALYKTVETFMVSQEKVGNVIKKNVTSYNPHLLRLFDAPINVSKRDKSAINYLYKGSAEEANKNCKSNIDNPEFNEIKHYLKNRSFFAPEACHRLFGFPVFQRYQCPDNDV